MRDVSRQRPDEQRAPRACENAPSNVTCSDCHIVPTAWNDDGHILHDGVAITAPAKVTFGARASATLDPTDRAGPPSWDGTTCSNVYCHGAVLARRRRHDTRRRRWTTRRRREAARGVTAIHRRRRATRATTARPVIRQVDTSGNITARTSTAPSRSGACQVAAAVTAARARRRRRSISIRQHVHDRARRRRAPRPPAGAVEDLGADCVRGMPRRAGDDRFAGAHRSAATGRHRVPRLGSHRADLRDRVVPRRGIGRCGPPARARRAAAATAFRRATRRTPRR